MEKTTLEVGDKIRIRNTFCNMVVEIERVTKTQAITKPYNDAGAVYRFKRTLYGGLKEDNVKPVTRERWDMTERTLITPKNNE